MGYPPTEIISPERLYDILQNSEHTRWRSHGIGMLRTYLDEAQDWRLNLWHGRLLNPGISTMHTHPWAFRSFVIAGSLSNRRWTRVEKGMDFAKPFHEGIIPCGTHAPKQHDEGPLIEGEPTDVWLRDERIEVYGHGEQYQQAPEEIHTTTAQNGTITVMHRNHYQPEGRASVFWPRGTPWGDASRHTDYNDVSETCNAALDMLDATPWSNQ